MGRVGAAARPRAASGTRSRDERERRARRIDVCDCVGGQQRREAQTGIRIHTLCIVGAEQGVRDTRLSVIEQRESEEGICGTLRSLCVRPNEIEKKGENEISNVTKSSTRKIKKAVQRAPPARAPRAGRLAATAYTGHSHESSKLTHIMRTPYKSPRAFGRTHRGAPSRSPCRRHT